MRNILLLTVLFITTVASAQNGTRKITLEDLWKKNSFKIKTVPGFNAMKDGRHYTQTDLEGGTQYIRVYDMETGKMNRTLFDNSSQTPGGEKIKVDDYSFSENEQEMLLFTESQNIYRRSILYKVYVLDLISGKISPVDKEKVLHASFSPDGSKVAFVKENNLYYKDLLTNKTIAVTTDGKWNSIINGNCDWVYEEEFEFTRAFQWAPDGKHIAFYRFDETLVPMYTIAYYDSLYPRQYTYKYPKAGELNSVIRILLYDLDSRRTTDANLGRETNQYIPRIKWTKDPSQLCIYRMNRHQNKLELLLANANTGTTSVIYEEENPFFIEINDNLQFLPDNESFIFNSEMSGYNHLYRWNWKKEQMTRLTKGKFDIETLVGVDEQTHQVYYTAAVESPMQRKLYAVDWNGAHEQTLTPEKGTHSITAISGYHYFLDKYSRLSKPPVYYLRDAQGDIVRTLEDNKDLAAKMTEYELGKIRFKKFPGAEEGVLLNAWMITPPDFDSNKKYPVLMFQYSGPNSQQVADRFPMSDFFWHQMLAEKGYIVVCADGTGTGFRGEKFRKKTYQQLGNLESNDQIAVARHLGTLPYVDKNRIGIWGWSYGGFMSSTCIMKGADVFKAAIAVAPVTNWRYYDNIYTERYMRTPQENPAGYDDNSPVQMVDKLKGKLLLIHGTGDDNVHFQNQVMLADALIKADKEFESEYYPNKTHGISGGNTRYHLYKRMTDFILNNL